MSYLTPIEDAPVLLLFGDVHTEEFFQPCDSPDCFEIQTDFMHVLNEFAKHRPVEFYLEAFMNPYIKEHAVALQQKYPTQSADDVFHHYYAKSNLTEMVSLYHTCFYHADIKTAHCPFPNIDWHFADIRTSLLYHTDRLYQEEHAYEFYTAYILKFIDALPTVTPFVLDDLYNLPGILHPNRYLSNSEMVDFLDYVVMVFTDTGPKIVDHYMASRTIKKQFDKLPDNIRSILSADSFVKLFRWYKKHTFSNAKLFEFRESGYIDFFLAFCKNLRKYYEDSDIYADEENSEKIAKLDDKAIQILTPFVFDAETVGLLYEVVVSNLTFVLDLYFISRMHKTPSKNKKRLVCGYFGYIHVLGIHHYFTRIVKTHRDGFYSVSKPYERRIAITKPIQLNQWFSKTAKTEVEDPTVNYIVKPSVGTIGQTVFDTLLKKADHLAKRQTRNMNTKTKTKKSRTKNITRKI